MGRLLVDYVKDIAYRLNQDTVGVRFLTLDAYPAKVNYYKDGLNFTVNQAIKVRPDRPVSMRIDIFD
ncbi:MAG: hypothetical protein FH756_19515 [Firmicutes bacterium]|nr:hypothetical protein [Bacillota bacterium]